jgi:hypothetical protein
VTWLAAYIVRPRISIGFSASYPHKAFVRFPNGELSCFIRVTIANRGLSTARGVQVFVRNIALTSARGVSRVDTDELMPVNYTPREANTYIRDIPRGVEFIADVAYTRQKERDVFLWAAFVLPTAFVDAYWRHIGDVSLEVVVIGENVPPKKRTIRYKFDGREPVIEPIVE